MNPKAKLCLILNNAAFFTEKEVSEQWGDDWGDRPYEHNAGEPYPDDEYGIYKVFFEGPFETPAQKASCGNSKYSVEMINRGDIAWLAPTEDTNEDNDFSLIPIHAGIEYCEFKRIVCQSGGQVYEPTYWG